MLTLTITEIENDVISDALMTPTTAGAVESALFSSSFSFSN